MVDQAWIRSLERLAAANDRAERERLAALTVEESVSRFEELCLEIHAEFDYVPPVKSHPVGLIKYWKKA